MFPSLESSGGLQARDGIPEDKHVQIPGSASSAHLQAQDAIRLDIRGWSRRDDKNRQAHATIRANFVAKTFMYKEDAQQKGAGGGA